MKKVPLWVDQFAKPNNLTTSNIENLPSFIKFDHFDNGNLFIYNLLPVDINITGIFFDNNKLKVLTSKSI